MQDVSGKMNGVEGHLFGGCPVTGPRERCDEDRGRYRTDHGGNANSRDALRRKTSRDYDDERKTDQPGLSELRLRQNDAEDTGWKHRANRHPAHLRPEDDEPNTSRHECDGEAYPSERQKPSIECGS